MPSQKFEYVFGRTVSDKHEHAVIAAGKGLFEEALGVQGQAGAEAAAHTPVRVEIARMQRGVEPTEALVLRVQGQGAAVEGVSRRGCGETAGIEGLEQGFQEEGELP